MNPDEEASRTTDTPPICNTGALSAKNKEIRLDHAAFTVKGSTVGEVQKRLGGEWQQGKGWRGYRESWSRRVGQGLTLMGAGMSGRAGEVHVQLAGAASGAMTFEEIKTLQHWVEGKQGHFTRVDIALDDFSGTLTPEKVEQAIEAGQMVSKSKRWNVQKSGDNSTGEIGKTVYIGSAKSKTRYVIYDKRAEQRAKGNSVKEVWTRLESRYQDERADEAMGVLCAVTEDQLWAVAVSWMVSALDFREINREMPSWEKSRAVRLDWWEEFTASLNGIKLLVEKVGHSIEKVALWVSAAIAPTLAAIVANKDLGWIWLEQQIMMGKTVWKEKHRELSVASVPAMMPV